MLLRRSIDSINNILIVSTTVLQVGQTLAEGKKGGYFCLADMQTGIPELLVMYGDPENPAGKAKYFSFAQEKAMRLAQNKHHKSSFESRIPENSKWGGAIRGHQYIYSFSGFPEIVDEASMLLTALLLDDLTHDEAYIIATQNKTRQTFETMLHEYNHTPILVL